MFDEKINFLNSFFDYLNSKNFNFVIPRGHQDLNNCSIKNDIDILIRDYDDKSIYSFMNTHNFSRRIDKFDYLYGAKPHIHYINNKLDLHFDLVDGLYYCSLNDNHTFLPVEELVLESFLNNKIRYKNYFIPKVEDELLHLICHCFYDKKKFPTKHVNRITELLDLIDNNIFLKLLNIIFGKTNNIVFNLIKNHSFDNFHNEIISFSEY